MFGAWYCPRCSSPYRWKRKTAASRLAYSGHTADVKRFSNFILSKTHLFELSVVTLRTHTAILLLLWNIYALKTDRKQAVVINKRRVPRKALAPLNYQLSSCTWCPLCNNRWESFVGLRSTTPLLASASTFSGNILRPRNMTLVAMEAKQPQLPKHGQGKWNDSAAACWRHARHAQRCCRTLTVEFDRDNREDEDELWINN